MTRRILWIGALGAAALACNNGATPAPTPAAPPAATAAPEKLPDVPAPPDVAAVPADATKLPSGLAFRVLKPGDGKTKLTYNDAAVANYSGWTTDGKMFHSTHGKTESLPLSRIPDGWVDSLLDMSKGEQRRVWIPEALAFHGQPGAPKGMTVVDFELVDMRLGVFKSVPPPEDVGAPPADAEKRPSGLVTKVLKASTETEHAPDNVVVVIEFTGWRSNGRMFDSSTLMQKPAELAVTALLPGLKEAVQLMVKGEKRRFWIPEALMYKGQRPPFGTLVFDIELKGWAVPVKKPADPNAPAPKAPPTTAQTQ